MNFTIVDFVIKKRGLLRMTPNSKSASDWQDLLRMAQGFACKDSAAATDVSPETIRARRKRIYHKLDVSGAGELISTLLALSLKMLKEGERIEPRPVQRPEQVAGTPPAMTH